MVRHNLGRVVVARRQQLAPRCRSATAPGNSLRHSHLSLALVPDGARLSSESRQIPRDRPFARGGCASEYLRHHETQDLGSRWIVDTFRGRLRRPSSVRVVDHDRGDPDNCHRDHHCGDHDDHRRRPGSRRHHGGLCQRRPGPTERGVQRRGSRTTLTTKTVSAGSEKLLRAIYADPLYAREIGVFRDEVANPPPSLLTPIGVRIMTVAKLFTAQANCIFISTHTDFSKISSYKGEPFGSEYYTLIPKSPADDPGHVNRTPWAFGFNSASLQPETIPDPC